MADILATGSVCVDCALIIANGDWSGVDDPDTHRARIESVGLDAVGQVVVTDDHDDFSSAPCDYCGNHLSGERFGIAILSV